MESEAADLRPGWETEARPGRHGMLCYWLQSGAYGIAGTGDGWWRVVDAAELPVSEWSCFEGSQIRAEELEEAEAGKQGPPESAQTDVPFAPLAAARVAHPSAAAPRGELENGSPRTVQSAGKPDAGAETP